MHIRDSFRRNRQYNVANQRETLKRGASVFTRPRLCRTKRKLWAPRACRRYFPTAATVQDEREGRRDSHIARDSPVMLICR